MCVLCHTSSQATLQHVGLGDSATGRAREASRRGATVVVCVCASPKSQRHRDRTRTAIGREHRFPSTSILQSMQGLQAIFVSQSSPGPQIFLFIFSDFPVFFVFFQSGRIPPKKPANPANPALFYTLKYIDYTCNERTERSRQHTTRGTHTHTHPPCAMRTAGKLLYSFTLLTDTYTIRVTKGATKEQKEAPGAMPRSNAFNKTIGSTTQRPSYRTFCGGGVSPA